MKSGAKAVVALAALLCCFAAPPPEGHWEGEIKLPTGGLKVDVDLSRKSDGSWSGDISIPQQGAKDLPLINIALDGDKIGFEIQGIPGTPTFKGRLGADGALAGDFTQSGQTLPFSLRFATAREPLSGFDTFVAEALPKWNVPGLAMAIVVDGEVVLSKGYGLRDVEHKLPVTPQTLFAIGSATKAFTTFTMGTLVDEGKMEWDKPAGTYIPWLRFEDSYVTERITPRDLVTHRSGLPRHDLTWYNSPATREDLVRRLAFLEPMTGLREQFHYQNLMYLTAGYLVEQVTGASWEETVRQRIFAPLGMASSNFSVADSQKAADHALPYDERDDIVKLIPFRDITTVGPAGSINSNLDDMIRWVGIHLSDGTAGGKKVIGKGTLADLHAPQMVLTEPAERPELPITSYALGWFVQPYRGHARLHHGGNIDGFAALVSFLPDDRIGMVVLTNMNGTGLPEILMRHAMDEMLGLPPIDWNAEALARLEASRTARKAGEKKKEMARVKSTRPAHDLREYAGEYEHPGYGIIKVAINGGDLSLTYNGISAPLQHWHYEVFSCGRNEQDPAFEDQKVMFLTSMRGDVDGLQSALEPQVADIVFKKKLDARMRDPQYLARFVGEYDLPGQAVRIELRGSVLTLNAPGQPQFELTPARLDEFVLKEYSVIRITFTTDAAGAVIEAIFDQPNGIFTAKRKE